MAACPSSKLKIHSYLIFGTSHPSPLHAGASLKDGLKCEMVPFVNWVALSKSIGPGLFNLPSHSQGSVIVIPPVFAETPSVLCGTGPAMDSTPAWPGRTWRLPFV